MEYISSKKKHEISLAVEKFNELFDLSKFEFVDAGECSEEDPCRHKNCFIAIGEIQIIVPFSDKYEIGLFLNKLGLRHCHFR